VADLLDLLAFDRIERVWLERKAPEGSDSGNAADGVDGADREFELHIVRTTTEGVVYEDRIATLSESEREVVGLVFALSGYLVHDVHERVPVMLLDSLEAIDAGRIVTLVDYFADFVPYLVVALLPEDANELDEAYDRIRAGRIGD
jgi:hypothetical protein